MAAITVDKIIVNCTVKPEAVLTQLADLHGQVLVLQEQHWKEELENAIPAHPRLVRVLPESQVLVQ